ncbi:MAG TPA: hypothetical protein VLF87_03455, partial [Patescibacteria group bacterium]|nr:hypothetical protein [Patescibacteria group bacterium]
SMPHEATKPERQAFIEKNLPKLVEQVKSLAIADTKLILIKSNVFDIAAKPLRDAGFNVINEQLIDYPGRFSQKAFQAKLPPLMAAHGWSS